MNKPQCAYNPLHGLATITFEYGALSLCSACAYRRISDEREKRQPVGAAAGGQGS